jgi:hypothetical protein
MLPNSNWSSNVLKKNQLFFEILAFFQENGNVTTEHCLVFLFFTFWQKIPQEKC